MHEYKMTSINSPRYPGIDIKKLRVCCIAHFGSKKNLFSSHIKSRGKAGYTGLISGPIIKSNEINHKTTCLSSLMQWSRKSNFKKKKVLVQYLSLYQIDLLLEAYSEDRFTQFCTLRPRYTLTAGTTMDFSIGRYFINVDKEGYFP